MSGRWQSSVPLDWDENSSRPEMQRHDTFGSVGSGGSNGYRENSTARAINRKPSDLNMQTRDFEPPRSRRPSAATTSTTSVAGKKRSMRNMKAPQRKPNETTDDSAWIHRDKLAQIEIQELEEAGIHIPGRPSQRSSSARPDSTRPGSRATSRNDHSRNQSKDGFNETTSSSDEAQNGTHASYEEPARKRVSTIPDSTAGEDDHGQEQEANYDYQVGEDYQTPEDAVSEGHRQRSGSVPRPGTSRIPVSRQSPMPVSHDVQERETPLSRSPEGSGAWDELQYARKARSGSIGSQILLDDASATRPSSSHLLEQNSPQKAKSPSKAGPKTRKTSGTATRGGRNNRATSSTGRPGSSSNNRPSTSQRSSPEGDPPWLANMYKPDPRLPPDQQMLPTHARRLAQEQWEKEGKGGTAYDTDFKLLNDEDPSKAKAPVLSLDQERLDSNVEQERRSMSPQKKRSQPSPSTEQENENTWPLPSPVEKNEAKNENTSVRPGTSGGYKITPTIAPNPPIQSPSMPTHSPRMSQRMSQQTQEGTAHNITPRIPVLDEKDEVKEKKGCCCVMM